MTRALEYDFVYKCIKILIKTSAFCDEICAIKITQHVHATVDFRPLFGVVVKTPCGDFAKLYVNVFVVIRSTCFKLFEENPSKDIVLPENS